MDWYGRTDLHHGDFYGNAKWVKMYDKICHGNIADLNEFEQEIAAGMIRKGYAVKTDDRISPAMPVYSEKQYGEILDLQKSVTEEIVNVFEKIQESVTAVLTNHVPVHLKKSVGEIAAMSLFHDGTYLPASLLVQNGFLSTDWIPGEIATSYVVMK